LFVAHDFALKGLAPLLQALAVLCRSPNVAPELLVAGRGPVLPFRRLARRLGIASQVHFLGATEVDASFYARGNVLVHPTYHDPCALVCIEALFSGLPVVTTWANGAAPWVQQAGGQVVDDAEDVEALAAAIAAALSQRAPLPASSELYKQFSWSGHLQRLEQLLRELARERGMPC
jgi:UDP-glucose:(heptosyl)LPS alpha-1,3-glucosyltransferase